MFCGAAGEALNPAEHPFNNLSALRASNWTSQFEYYKYSQNPAPCRDTKLLRQLHTLFFHSS
jgi:hypothetical protein